MNLIFFTSDFLSTERENRFHDIKTTFHSIAQIKANKKKIIFHCNVVSDEYLLKLKNYIGDIDVEIEFVRLDKQAEYVDQYNCGPAQLTWEHKKYLNWFIESEFNYFIYWENDMLFQQHHIDYWIENSQLLKKYGMKFIPAFLRVEYTDQNVIVSVDCTKQINSANRPIIELNRRKFLSHPEPYHGLFILDKEDANELKQSNKLTRDDYLKNMTGHLKYGTCESANQSLMIENVPAGFEHRSVLPLDDIHRCLIHHLPNKFAKEKHYPFSTIPISNLII